MIDVMPVFEKRSLMPASREQLAAYHERPGALERLIPPWERVKVLENVGPLADGKRVKLAMKIGPVTKEWEAEHFDVVPGRRFRDRATRGPFAAWTHSHLFKDAGHESELTDEVDYTLPLGTIGRLGNGYTQRELARMFSFRHVRTANDLARHAIFADHPRLRVAVSGANGAIAANLMPFLTTAGHEVRRLVRGKAAAADEIAWNAKTGEIDQASMEECDALVHLAGRNIAVRWSARNRDEIKTSRVDATRKLCETLARMSKQPKTLVCASAVGFYGDRGEQELDEYSERGQGFAAKMCEAWERATDPAREAGIRVVNLRIGVVISGNSGAIAKLLTPAKFGMAGRLGSGKQWMPWIAMDDIVAAIETCVHDESLSGAINGVTGSIRQKSFVAALGRVLKRPTLAPLPAIGVRVIFGEMGRELLLASANVQPARLRGAGFEPTFPTMESALRFELGRA